jgi:hypothetical protein
MSNECSSNVIELPCVRLTRSGVFKMQKTTLPYDEAIAYDGRLVLFVWIAERAGHID